MCRSASRAPWWRRLGSALATVATLSTPTLAQEKAAFLFPGSINDQSWNAQGYAGAERLKELGWQIAAARMSKTGKVGSVNGLEGLPNVVAQVGGFRKGAKSVNPNIEVKVIYTKGMEDAAEAKEAALSLIGGGADFIFGKLNAGHAGLIQAAKEKGIYVSGRSFGHTAIAPDNVLTNIVEKWGDMYSTAAEASKSGKVGGQYMLYGYNAQGSAGADLRFTPERPYNSVVPEAVASEIEALKKKFASGDLKLSVTREDARGGT